MDFELIFMIIVFLVIGIAVVYWTFEFLKWVGRTLGKLVEFLVGTVLPATIMIVVGVFVFRASAAEAATIAVPASVAISAVVAFTLGV